MSPTLFHSKMIRITLMEINGLMLLDYFFNLFIFNGSVSAFLLPTTVLFNFKLRDADLLSCVMADGSSKK